MKNHKLCKAFLLIAVLIIVSSSCSGIKTNQNCTIITASNDKNVLYANNEDTHFKELIIGFIPASDGKYGSVKFGYMYDGNQNYQGAVNDQGLIWDVNSVAKTKMTAHPEKPYSHLKDNYLSYLTNSVSSVREAIELARKFDFGDSMKIQIHIADASGDAVVISPGPDGEVVFTRKGATDRYIVSTNFSLADDGKNKCWRYDKANEMLAAAGNSEFTVDYISRIIEEVHLRTIQSFTLYSNIVDLTNRKIYLYYMSQYNERIELDIDEELKKGFRVVDMSSLFSKATVDTGDADYHRFEVRFTVFKVAVVATAIVLLVGIIVITVVIIKKRKKKHERKRNNRKDQEPDNN